MSTRFVGRRAILGAAGVAFAVTSGALAVGWPVGNTTAFGPLPTGQSQPLWHPTEPKRAAVKVTVSGTLAAEVRVQQSPQVLLGHVKGGDSCVFEGDWTNVDVVALTANVSGQGVVRVQPPAGTFDDGIVGEGSITLTTAAPNVSPYSNSAAPAYRAIVVQASSDPVVVSREYGDPPLVTVGAGDWGFCGASQCRKFTLAGKGTVPFKIVEIRPGCGPIAGTASGGPGETDMIAVDGTVSLSVRLTNKGPSPIQAIYAMQGGPDVAITIQPAPAPPSSAARRAAPPTPVDVPAGTWLPRDLDHRQLERLACLNRGGTARAGERRIRGAERIAVVRERPNPRRRFLPF
jgi:hypothetical protein